MGKSKECLERFQVYKEQPVRERVLFRCLYEICHHGWAMAEKKSEANPQCRSCTGTVAYCIQVKESGGKLYFRVEEQKI
jgi:hypothetical protein